MNEKLNHNLELGTIYRDVFTRNGLIRVRIKGKKFTIKESSDNPYNLLKAANVVLQVKSMVSDGLFEIESVTTDIINNIFKDGYFKQLINQSTRIINNLNSKNEQIQILTNTPTFREIFSKKQQEYESRESVIPYEKEQLKAGSIITYNSYLAHRFKEFLDIKIANLSLNDIINFIDKHRDRDNSYDYVDNLFIPLREIFEDHIELGDIKINVFKNTFIKKHMRRVLKKTEKNISILSENSIQLLIEAPHCHIRSTVLFGLFSGGRIGETIIMNYEQINFRNNSIKIIKQFSSGYQVTPKSKNSIREIPIVMKSKNPNHVNKFENILYEVLVYEYNKRNSTNITNIFYDPATGNPWKRSDKLNEVMRAYLSSIGVHEYITFHDLRYWFTAYAIELVGVQETSKLLGHKTIEETIRDYTRIKPQNLLSKEEAQKLKVFKTVAPKLPQIK